MTIGKKRRYSAGEIINYTKSVSITDSQVIPDGYQLDQIYIVEPKKEGSALVISPVDPDRHFDYSEDVAGTNQLVQALRNTKNDNIMFRLVTGISKVYGVVTFHGKRIQRRHIRSISQFEAYVSAADVIRPDSYHPHRLVSKVEEGTKTTFTFETPGRENRTIEFEKVVYKPVPYKATTMRVSRK